MDSNRLFLNLFGQIASFICNVGISFFLTPYIVMHLGKESYGFVGLANNITSYITLVTIAINGMLSRYITIAYTKKDYDESSGYFTTALISQGVLALVLVIPMMLLAGNMNAFFNVSAEIIPDVKILWILIFLSFLAGLPMGGFGSAAFATNHLEIQAVINIVGNATRACALIGAFVFFTPHVWYVGLATIASNTVIIISNVLTKQKLMPEVKISIKHFSPKYIHNLLVVGVWNSLNRLQQILYSGLDLMITNLFINGTEMGTLSIAKAIPTQISILISTISGTFDPTMTISYGKGDMEDFVNQTTFAMKFSGFLCSVPILGFIAYGSNFYHLWMPTLSDAEVTKIQILSVLTLLPQVFSVYVFPLYTVNTITCKLKVPVLVSIGIGIASIIIVFILLQVTNLGVYAVAGVSSILWLFRIFLFVPTYAAWNVEIRWTTFYGPIFRGVVNVVIVGGGMLILSHFLYGYSWLQFCVICGISGLLGYVVCFFSIFEQDDRKRAIEMLKKKFLRKKEQ